MEVMTANEIMFESILTLDPLLEHNGFDNDIYFDPMEVFKTESTYIDNILNEAADTKKKNILSRLWDTVKKIVKWIGAKIVQMVKGIKRAIFGKKKSANQILKQMKINKHEVQFDKVDSDDPELGKKAAMAGYYSFIEGFYEDGVVINPAGLVSTNPEKASVKGKDINGGGTRANVVISLMLNPAPLDEYIEFFKQLTGEIQADQVTPADMKRIATRCAEFSGRPSIIEYIADGLGNTTKGEYKEIYVSIDQFMEFQRKVDEVCRVGEEFDNTYNALNVNLEGIDADTQAKYIKVMNELAWACVNLQGGLHVISNGLQGIYDIDPGYIGSIDKLETLAEFVSESLKSGMPNKYLVRNIYLVCDKKLKGNPNMDKPIMGFGRLTLIPEGDVIYKIAINRYGIRSNKNDFAVMKEVKGTPLMDKFAETTHTIGDYVINVMEKVKAGSSYEPSAAKASELGKEINAELEKNGVGFEIHDIKSDAFGMKNDKYVLLDYGYLHRRGFSAQTHNDNTSNNNQ